jgi:hypothetical protein
LSPPFEGRARRADSFHLTPTLQLCAVTSALQNSRISGYLSKENIENLNEPQQTNTEKLSRVVDGAERINDGLSGHFEFPIPESCAIEDKWDQV